MRIGDQAGAVQRERWAQVCAIEAGEPELAGLDRGIGTPDHFEFQVGDNAFQRDWRMLQEVLVALPARFFAAKENKKDSAPGTRTCRQSLRQLQYGDAAGGIVVGAVVDAVAVYRFTNAEVVHVGGEEDDLVLQFGIATAKDPDHVARVPR